MLTKPILLELLKEYDAVHLLLRKFIGRYIYIFEIETCIMDHMTYDNIVVNVNKTSLVKLIHLSQNINIKGL